MTEKIFPYKSWTAVPNSLLNDRTLTAKAKALWMYIRSKPPQWSFSEQKIAAQMKDGVDAIRSGLQELENAGLLERKMISNGRSGSITLYVLRLPKGIAEVPYWENPSMEEVPHWENPSAQEVPCLENPSAQEEKGVPYWENPSMEEVPYLENPSAQEVPCLENPSAQEEKGVPHLENPSAQEVPYLENPSVQGEKGVPHLENPSVQGEKKVPHLDFRTGKIQVLSNTDLEGQENIYIYISPFENLISQTCTDWDDHSVSLLKEFLSTPMSGGKKRTERSAKMVLNEMKKIPEGKRAGALEQAIQRGYSGINADWFTQKPKTRAKTELEPEYDFEKIEQIIFDEWSI